MTLPSGRRRVLPALTSKDDYVTIYMDTPAWLPAMRAICARHDLDPSGLGREPPGTHVVFRTGSTILKLFSPFWGDDFTPSGWSSRTFAVWRRRA